MSIFIPLKVWTPDGPVPCSNAPELWIDDHGKGAGAYRNAESELAIDICNTQCEYREECLISALDEERGVPPAHRNGIRGGLTPPQRARIDPALGVGRRA